MDISQLLLPTAIERRGRFRSMPPVAPSACQQSAKADVFHENRFHKA
jgi:hypothetical protein